jgi:hypothetical protein
VVRSTTDDGSAGSKDHKSGVVQKFYFDRIDVGSNQLARVNGRNRRDSVIAARFGQGPLTKLTAALASSAGLASIGIGGTLPARTRASSSRKSSRVPT